ncbi:NUDIX domain-containing protein [Streptomyces sp. NPDC057101]|uniref:NUDIX domain-containing protein n=1 Tax=Streptomyces sp. NPDC057101 TaxID=3346020 RepID=UPI00362D146F
MAALREPLGVAGWHVDEDETSLRAAARELEEEAGVRVAEDELRLVGCLDQPDRDPRGRYVTIAYPATAPQTVTRDDARWWPLTDLPGRSRSTTPTPRSTSTGGAPMENRSREGTSPWLCALWGTCAARSSSLSGQRREERFPIVPPHEGDLDTRLAGAHSLRSAHASFTDVQMMTNLLHEQCNAVIESPE